MSAAELAGYYPTCHLRVMVDHEFISDERIRKIEVLQQLWVSVCDGDEPKWVELPRVDLTHSHS